LNLALCQEFCIGDTTPFREARELAFSILDREKLAAVADRITAEAVFDETTYV
jgi:hypothetical protein